MMTFGQKSIFQNFNTRQMDLIIQRLDEIQKMIESQGIFTKEVLNYMRDKMLKEIKSRSSVLFVVPTPSKNELYETSADHAFR